MEYSYFSSICYFSNTIDGFHRLYIYIVTNKVKKKDGEVFRSDMEHYASVICSERPALCGLLAKGKKKMAIFNSVRHQMIKKSVVVKRKEVTNRKPWYPVTSFFFVSHG